MYKSATYNLFDTVRISDWFYFYFQVKFLGMSSLNIVYWNVHGLSDQKLSDDILATCVKNMT